MCLLQVCGPAEAIVLSGREHRQLDGTIVRYRFIVGGRVWAWPLLERVDRISLAAAPVEVSVRNAYSDGGIPLHVEALALVRVATHRLAEAIERFLGRDPAEIRRVAAECLGGHLRAQVAACTPETADREPAKLAERVLEAAHADLEHLGIAVDTLTVVSVEDDVGYLSASRRSER